MTKHRHFILYKPKGYLSQFVNNQTKRKNKKLLGSLYKFPEGTMSIGRLDENSEGLLFLTTDGKVSEQVRSRKVEKEYYVQADGIITAEAVKQLQEGVIINVHGKDYKTLPCTAALLTPAPSYNETVIRHEKHGPTSWFTITISEGKFRQVRKMSAAVGFPTLRLIRVRIGNTLIDDLTPGNVIEVTNFELD